MSSTAGALHLISRQLDRGEIDGEQFLLSFTRTLARVIGCSRAGVWVFADPPVHRRLRCLAMHDAVLDRAVHADDMSGPADAAYFDALSRDGWVNAPDAWNHPATRCFRADYLEPLDVRSVLDVGYSINGVPIGIFSCEQVGSIQVWNGRQLQLLRAIGPRAALSLITASSGRSLDTQPGALFEPRDPAARLTRVLPLQ